ncbi:tetratricopeptide repeat protein [Pseudoalteromonas sp. S16_S37]|uniref:tetratricopeptide repeat protein n=1 Tax=Pseudoalteromonas sp. S16_S37 TaxID=2720228 RepID=UPI0016807CA8|nr:tetratricopeptide repeat protein [Pseudoalteromonas sp. S16_S37]MBD1583704.1 tetratricopeptide repeat protein [Pseudoalteromonas sp. S16_S37]
MSTLSTASSNTDPEYEISRAQYFMRSDPEQSLAILNKISNVDKLPDEQQVAFHVLKLRTSLTLNYLDDIDPILETLFKLDEKPAFSETIVAILSGTGIWLRKTNYFDAAQHVFSCALKHADKSSQRISLLISSAIVARYKKDYTLAKSIYSEASNIAMRLDDVRAMATINNNLGTIAMDQGNIKEAEAHFREALTAFQLANNHSGHINSGINLLFTFVLQNKSIDFLRLYPHISQLSDEYPDESKKAYLFWVNSAYQYTQGVKLTDQQNKELIIEFNKLAGPQLKTLIKIHLASLIGIEVPIVEHIATKKFENKTWFNKVLSCNW